MPDSNKIVKKLLETDIVDWQAWPEFEAMTDADFNDYMMDCPEVYLAEYGGWYAVDYDRNFLLSLEPRNHSYRLDRVKMAEILQTLSDGYEQSGRHGYGPNTAAGASTSSEPWPKWEPEPEPQEYSLQQKMAYKVYESGDYIFLKLPSDVDFIRREGTDMSHPVAGDTRIITHEGVFPIRDLVGKKVKLLTRPNGKKDNFRQARWAAAEIKSFDAQPVTRLTLTRHGFDHVVYATAGHRWYAFNNTRNKQFLRLLEKTTETLEVGNRIPSVFIKRVLFKSESPKGISLSAVGVMHGIVFGDGHATVKVEGQTARSGKITLYGKKDAELLRWFPSDVRRANSDRSIGGTELSELPRFFKKLPDLNECPAYTMGWLAGYFAADGNVTVDGVPSLNSACRENLEFASILCQRFGIRVGMIKQVERVGYNKEGKTSTMFRLPFEVGNLPKDFFLIQAHRDRVKPRVIENNNWIVKSIEPAAATQEVFCAIVPETGCFVLEGNILTGNCLRGSHNSYSQRMEAGQIEVYSMTDKRTNRPVIDVEVALTKGSYSSADVERPCVTQIRGVRNECPPKDEYLPALMDFLQNFGKGWQLTGHRVQNFDGTLDGERVLRRWRELQGHLGGS